MAAMLAARPETMRLAGPFSGSPDGNLPMRRVTAGRSYGSITSPEAARVFQLVVRCKALSRKQAAVLARLGEHGARRAIERLFRLGFLDRLEIPRTPPLYVAGPEAAKRFSLVPEEWDVLRALRLAAAAQLCLRLRDRWPDAEYRPEPHLGLTASMTLGSQEYGVLCPRLWPGDVSWCQEMAEALPSDSRVIVVAGDGEQARELARLLPDIPLRFTWDAILSDGLRLWRREGKKIVEDPLDFRGQVCQN